MPEIPFQLEAERMAKKFAESLKITAGITLQYDKKSVKELEGFIEQLRQRKLEGAERIIKNAGIWLGECISTLFGGQWQYNEEFKEWGISFAKNKLIKFDELTAFPISKAYKQYENGLSDSVYGYIIGIEVNLK